MFLDGMSVVISRKVENINYMKRNKKLADFSRIFALTFYFLRETPSKNTHFEGFGAVFFTSFCTFFVIFLRNYADSHILALSGDSHYQDAP